MCQNYCREPVNYNKVVEAITKIIFLPLRSRKVSIGRLIRNEEVFIIF